MDDSDTSDIFTRSDNIWLVYSSYIAVTRSYIWYVTVIHNVFIIYIYDIEKQYNTGIQGMTSYWKRKFVG